EPTLGKEQTPQEQTDQRHPEPKPKPQQPKPTDCLNRPASKFLNVHTDALIDQAKNTSTAMSNLARQWHVEEEEVDRGKFDHIEGGADEKKATADANAEKVRIAKEKRQLATNIINSAIELRFEVLCRIPDSEKRDFVHNKAHDDALFKALQR